VSGANLTALPATLPAASGANLTALNATQLTSGTVPIGRLGSSGTPSASTYLRGDNTWATVSGGGLASDSFATISVAGQSNVVADSATDTLTLVAGTGITITTDAGTDTVTITNSGSSQNTFSIVAVAGQSNVEADSTTDTLTLSAGSGISITTDASTDTVTITSTVSAGATSFTGLSDRADLTIDQFYLQAITRLNVTNNGASAYRFDQYGTTDDPTVYAINGTTIAFNLNVTGHPFLIQDGAGANYNTGLVHVTTGGTVTTGASAQGQTSGTLYWKIPDSITGSYRYQCSVHAAMIGTIQIKNFASI
jgi:plastocyanin